MRKRPKHVIILVISILLILTGCQRATNSDTSGKLQVYTSIYTMYDFALKIGGDRVAVRNLVPPGTEPHDFEPKARDISRLEKSDILIYNGAKMEPWIEKLLKSIKNKDIIVLEASKDIKLIENIGEEKQSDPHVWLNPMNAKKQMLLIKKVFVEADPANASYYEENFKQIAKKLDDLDKLYKEETSRFTKKDIIVAHEAFGYLCNAYGLNQMAIEGLNADAEPSPLRMAEISSFAKKNNVKYIFFEELVSPKVAKSIAKEVGAQTEMLNPIESISLEDQKKGREYFSIMYDNLDALKKALK